MLLRRDYQELRGVLILTLDLLEWTGLQNTKVAAIDIGDLAFIC